MFGCLSSYLLPPKTAWSDLLPDSFEQYLQPRDLVSLMSCLVVVLPQGKIENVFFPIESHLSVQFSILLAKAVFLS